MTTLSKTAIALAVIVTAAQPLAAQAQNYVQSAPQNYAQDTYQSTSQDDSRYSSHPYDPARDDNNDRYASDRDAPPPPPLSPTYQDRDGNQYRDDNRNDGRYADNRYADNRGAPPPNPNDRRYDGYCYERRNQATTTGTILGAIAGGLIGNSVSRYYDRGGNTIAGAAVGAAIGNSAGRSSVTCEGGRYYAYDEGYYAPPPPPEGYTVVYYEQRPPVEYYERVYTYRDYYPGPVYHRYYGGYAHYGYGHRW